MSYSNAKYIIFGAGSFGESVYSNFINKKNVLGFVDNNKNSKKIYNLTVSTIEFLFNVKFDYIIICSEPGKFEILKQLISLNIDKTKILIAEKNNSEIIVSRLEKVDDIFVKEQIDSQSFLHNQNNYLQLLDKFNQLNNSVKSNLIFFRKEHTLRQISKKFNNKEKIKVAFFVIWSSQFTFSGLFELMRNDKSPFDPFIIVCRIPNLSVEDNSRYANVYEKSLKDLTDKYGEKYVKQNYVNGRYVYLLDNIDIAFFSMIHPYAYDKSSLPETLFKNNILLYFCEYSIDVAKKTEQEIITVQHRYSQLNFFYKIYTINNYLSSCISNDYHIKYIGYPKLDEFSKFENQNKTTKCRKKIILAPHQDFNKENFCGNFLKTYKLYYQLPDIYPEIDFIFRPHPLLIPNLYLYWGKKKTDSFINKVLSNKNVTLDSSSFYYQNFAESDAIIHDCGSFLVEYLITSKPEFFLEDDPKILDHYLNDFSKSCIDHIYLGHTLKQACSFIDKVVIGEIDNKKEKRTRFVNKYVKYNYPNINKKIFEDIMNDLS
ncbi:hypothetical protein [Succinivibrio dextrinosolvens]|uniref:hypothetical protein n=1 Tax=Succinivibrio dextrinosolvens TaxID=83771 RepID=UPI0004E1DA94|nr:hypothetical protein [Succinivibrio dextrinosolvens]